MGQEIMKELFPEQSVIYSENSNKKSKEKEHIAFIYRSYKYTIKAFTTWSMWQESP